MGEPVPFQPELCMREALLVAWRHRLTWLWSGARLSHPALSNASHVCFLPLQEFMILPTGASSFAEAMRVRAL